MSLAFYLPGSQCFKYDPMFLSCFTGALRHRHSDTLCWEDHLEHHGQVTHGWKGHSPRGATHDPRNHPVGAWRIQEKQDLAGMKCSCEILTFNTKKSKTVGLVLSPNVIVCLIVWHMKIPRCEGHFDRFLMLLPNNLKIWLSHPIHKRSLHFGIPHQKKVILTVAYGTKETENRLEQHILHSSLHNGCQ